MAIIGAQILGHTKVGHLGLPITDQEYIVTAKIAVQYAMVMEVGESLCHIVANVHLHV
jgi:hypothetical protein